MLTRPRAVDDETIRVLDLFGIAVARDVPLCRQPAGGDAADDLVGGNPEAFPPIEVVEKPKRAYSNLIHGITEMKRGPAKLS
jgi:hypothetical protein